MPEGCSWPTKAPLVEEFEDESKNGPPLAQPYGLVPLVGSHLEEDIEMDVAQGILYLSKCFFVLILLYVVAFLLALNISLPSLLQVT